MTNDVAVSEVSGIIPSVRNTAMESFTLFSYSMTNVPQIVIAFSPGVIAVRDNVTLYDIRFDSKKALDPNMRSVSNGDSPSTFGSANAATSTGSGSADVVKPETDSVETESLPGSGTGSGEDVDDRTLKVKFKRYAKMRLVKTSGFVTKLSPHRFPMAVFYYPKGDVMVNVTLDTKKPGDIPIDLDRFMTFVKLNNNEWASYKSFLDKKTFYGPDFSPEDPSEDVFLTEAENEISGKIQSEDVKTDEIIADLVPVCYINAKEIGSTLRITEHIDLVKLDLFEHRETTLFDDGEDDVSDDSGSGEDENPQNQSAPCGNNGGGTPPGVAHGPEFIEPQHGPDLGKENPCE